MTELSKYNEGGPDEFAYGIELIKDTTKDTYNVAAFCDDISVWESLFAKSMQARFMFTDGAGLMDQIALQPGDKVRIVMYKGSSVKPNEKIDKLFEIMTIGSGVQTTNKQGRVYVISCVTAPAMLNKITTVNKALSGLLSDMAGTIAKDYLKIDKIELEPSAGDKKSVVMPGRQPFKILSWLALHAVSAVGGVDNSFYLFYEDRDGFRFKTVRGILSDATHHEYTMTADNSRTGGKEDLYRISSWQQNKIGNNAQRLDEGLYDNEVMQFNVKDRTIASTRFNFKDEAKKLLLLGATPLMDLTNNFDSLSQKDSVGKAKGAIASLKIRSNEEAYGEVNTYGRKHSAMMAQKQMFNQISFSFSFTGNCRIKAGDILDVVATDLSSVDKGKEFDAFVNGKFLIGNVRHRIIAGTSFATSVDVFKDGMDKEYKPKSRK